MNHPLILQVLENLEYQNLSHPLVMFGFFIAAIFLTGGFLRMLRLLTMI